MRLRHIAIGLMMLFCLNVFGQQQKTVPMTAQPQKTEIQALEETVLQLQAENQAMQKQMERMGKEIEICREDVRHKESTINDNQGHWLTVLSIVIGAIVTILGVGLGVVAPILLNLRNDRKQKKNIEKVRAELKSQINSAQQDAKSAKDSLSEIIGMKDDIENIKKDIDKSKKTAERAAKRAMATKYFTQAYSEKDKQKAVELYTKAIELDPNFSDAYSNRGVLKNDLGDPEGAMKDYDKAIELDQNNAAAYNNRGNLKKDSNDFEGAMIDYDKAIGLDQNSAITYCNRGNLKDDKGDSLGALKDYEKVIELEPNNAIVLNNRACILSDIGEYNKALDSVNDALVIDSNKFAFWETKGEISMKMDDYEGAEFAFTKALALNPKDKESLKNRAKCYRTLAEIEQDLTKKANLIAKAEADEQKAASLK